VHEQWWLWRHSRQAAGGTRLSACHGDRDKLKP
jgi:hypothetical protein